MAFYNNGFPVNYQYPQYYPTAPQSQQTGGPIWVQGEAGAKSYLVAPNATVALWDSEANVIYLKSADPSGMPQMKVLDYTIRGGKPLNQETEYATKADLEELRKKLDELMKGAE